MSREWERQKHIEKLRVKRLVAKCTKQSSAIGNRRKTKYIYSNSHSSRSPSLMMLTRYTHHHCRHHCGFIWQSGIKWKWTSQCEWNELKADQPIERIPSTSSSSSSNKPDDHSTVHTMNQRMKIHWYLMHNSATCSSHWSFSSMLYMCMDKIGKHD